jgi:hypothetical protein
VCGWYWAPVRRLFLFYERYFGARRGQALERMRYCAHYKARWGQALERTRIVRTTKPGGVRLLSERVIVRPDSFVFVRMRQYKT